MKKKKRPFEKFTNKAHAIKIIKHFIIFPNEILFLFKQEMIKRDKIRSIKINL